MTDIIVTRAGTGRAAKDLLSRHLRDDRWATDLAEVRALLVTEGRDWTA